MKEKIRNILMILLLPIFLLRDVIKSERKIIKKIIYVFLVLLIFGLIWINGFNAFISFTKISLFELGITDKITQVKISGTSMMPTLKDGSDVVLNSPKKFGIKRGDIVTFQNKETGSMSYIKRVIGLEGEKISIKNGNYYINDKALLENYTLNDLPTFGNTFLADCEEMEIPQGKYFVSGDNRTVSSDSRVIGLIDINEIDGVIKTSVKEEFADSATQNELTNINIDSKKFLDNLNSKRKSGNSPTLSTNKLLNNIANERAREISGNYENWKKDLKPLDKLLDSKAYKFNSVHEYVTFGYLNEKDILNQILELKEEKDNFLSSSFTEVGIGVAQRKYKECKYPVISVILSWPAIPTYNQADIESWQKEITITKAIMSNLQGWIGAPKVDNAKIRKMITLTSIQNQTATRIYTKMKNREWLSTKDYEDIENYNKSVKEYEAIYQDVFGDVKGVSSKRFPLSN